MKLSYNWLCELTGLTWSPEEMGDRLTLCGTACEDIVPAARFMSHVVVGSVLDLVPIKGATKIKLATIDIGREQFIVVCGAPNIKIDQKVVLALVGAELANDVKVKKAKIRGIESAGMVCSEMELGISNDHSGILVLPDDAPAGTSLVDYLEYDDYQLTFELTPNRGDSMSAIGVARDLSALAMVAVVMPEISLREIEDKAKNHLSVTIDDPQGCLRYSARVIRNITVGESPWWIKRKLLLSGIRPISNVVDITNLVMMETGQPLHAFDLKTFGSDKVVVRRAQSGEKFTTLDGREHELSNEVLLITNGRKAVAAAGVMGGLDSEVSSGTTEIILESAYFDPRRIRRSRKELGFVTESSIRFEKGVDPEGVVRAADRAAYLFQEICGGEVLKGVVDCYPSIVKPREIKFRPQRCNDLLGTSLKPGRMRDILVALQMSVDEKDPWVVTVPTFRPDLEREVDLIEEVARIEGYDSIPDSVSNVGPLFNPSHAIDWFEDRVRTTLIGIGFDETLGHGLARSSDLKRLNPNEAYIKLVNPVSEELDVVRSSLMSVMLGVVANNIAHRTLDLKLFEMGKTYCPPDSQDRWVEELRLSLAVTGSSESDWRVKGRRLDFYDISGALETLVDHFRWPALECRPVTVPFLDPAAAFDVYLADMRVGYAGLLKEKMAREFDIKQAVYVAEINLEPMMAKSEVLRQFKPLPIYPSSQRDIALVLDKGVRVGDLVRQARSVAGELVRQIDVFDLYEGKQIPAGKKSIAIRIEFRSDKESLASEQVDAIMANITEQLKSNFSAEIRDR